MPRLAATEAAQKQLHRKHDSAALFGKFAALHAVEEQVGSHARPAPTRAGGQR